MSVLERRVTAADVARDEQRTRNVVEQVVQLFSLQPEDSPCHNIADTERGLSFCVPVQVFLDKTVYVYACSWSRGWSIFATDDDNAGAHSWRYVKREYQGLQRPLYAPRECTGPWLVPPNLIAEAVVNIVEHLQKLDRARRARFSKKYWYWPRAAAQAKTKGGD